MEKGIKWPQAINEFYQFMEGMQDDFLDFELVTDGYKRLASLVPAPCLDHFIVIGKHGSDSLVCYWKPILDLPLEMAPIVWLDSEGTPNSVFAISAEEFLRLLPYGLGGIYDVVSSWIYHYSEPDEYANPLDKYSDEAIRNYRQMAGEDYAAYGSFIHWLEKDMQLTVHGNPIKAIGDAISKFPNLEHWLAANK